MEVSFCREKLLLFAEIFLFNMTNHIGNVKSKIQYFDLTLKSKQHCFFLSIFPFRFYSSFILLHLFLIFFHVFFLLHFCISTENFWHIFIKCFVNNWLPIFPYCEIENHSTTRLIIFRCWTILFFCGSKLFYLRYLCANLICLLLHTIANTTESFYFHTGNIVQPWMKIDRGQPIL